MDRLMEMSVFQSVADRKSFAAAARHLGLSPPTITRAVSALEKRIGTRLFTRTTRFVHLTEAGAQYFEDVKRIFALIEGAENMAAGAHAVPRGRIAITAPVLFGQMIVMPIVTDFLKANPEVTANVLLVDRFVSVAEEGFDVAIRIGDLPDSSMVAVRVGQVRRVVVAAPGYLAREGTPANPRELSHRSIVMTSSASSSTEWRFRGEQGRALAVKVEPSLNVNLNQAAITATVRGWGLTQVLSYQVAAEVADGKLQIVLAEYELPPLPVNVVYPEARKASAKVRGVVAFLADRIRKEPAVGRASNS
jgi:DNA-binding transcriptional LysR family regulator